MRYFKIENKFVIDFYGCSPYNKSAGRNALYTLVIELVFKRHVMAPTERHESVPLTRMRNINNGHESGLTNLW